MFVLLNAAHLKNSDLSPDTKSSSKSVTPMKLNDKNNKNLQSPSNLDPSKSPQVTPTKLTSKNNKNIQSPSNFDPSKSTQVTPIKVTRKDAENLQTSNDLKSPPFTPTKLFTGFSPPMSPSPNKRFKSSPSPTLIGMIYL